MVRIGTLEAEKLREAISQIVSGEDKDNALSDKAICRRLAKLGIHVQAYNVAYHRKVIGLGGHFEREAKYQADNK